MVMVRQSPRVSFCLGGLAAAGLGGRHLDAAARLLQQPDGGEADGGAVDVHQAGDEEGDAGRGHGLKLGAKRAGVNGAAARISYPPAVPTRRE